MNDQVDLDSINDKLYTLDVPTEPLKKIMFYFTVLSNVIDLRFPENYLNFDHPYFKSYNRMEEFLSLARALNPDFLYHNNVIIFHNKKDIYKYYHKENDTDGLPYEFKVINADESVNPIYKNNYKNNFNIANINPYETEFTLSLTNKVDFPHSEDSAVNTIEDHYYHEEDEYENPFEPNEDYYDRPNVDYNEIRDYFDESEIQKNTEFTLQSYAYANQMNSTNEFEEDEYDLNDITNFYEKKVKIINKLVVTKDWIDYIYKEPIKDLLINMKKVIKDEDVIRSKSISLPKNIFFYLEFLMLALLMCCSVVLFCYSISLEADERFHKYEGKNESDYSFFPLFHSKNLLLNDNDNHIDYSNDSFIIPNPKRHKIIKSNCQMSIVSSVFGAVYFVLIVYMCIRISREDKRKYQKRELKNEAGLNCCHIAVLIGLTIVVIILALIAEILNIVTIALKTYDFIHDYVRTQLILNTIIFVSYFLIQYFYCMI